MGYWDLLHPISDEISIYNGPEAFLAQLARCEEAPRLLFAAHWCQSEVCNGGFAQFFGNSTGVLAPEAVDGFCAIGMSQTAGVIVKAMKFFRPVYTRVRNDRNDALQAWYDARPATEVGPFDALDDEFLQLISTENGGFEVAADAYAAEHHRV